MLYNIFWFIVDKIIDFYDFKNLDVRILNKFKVVIIFCLEGLFDDI